MIRQPIHFLDSNQFFFKNGSVFYYRPGKSYLDKLTHGLSLDSVLYSRDLVSLATKPTEKVVSCPAEIAAQPRQIKYEYDEHAETRAKLPTRSGKKKLSKRDFLKTFVKIKKVPSKLAFVPKRSKTNKLKARDTKSWHRGEYTRTNPDSHNDECECQDCGEDSCAISGWINRDDDDDDDRDWCDYLSDVSYEEEYDGPELIEDLADFLHGWGNND
jgi:hypothetical protein